MKNATLVLNLDAHRVFLPLEDF